MNQLKIFSELYPPWRFLVSQKPEHTGLGSLKPDNNPGFSVLLAVRGSKWEENLFFCRIGHCCSNEIPERSGHKGGWCSNIKVMSGRKAFCCKSNIILVRDKYMFSIVEYRILILFDRPFIFDNVTFPISWTLFLSRNVLIVIVFSLPASECSFPLLWVCYYDSGYMNNAITDNEMSLLNYNRKRNCCSLG